MRSAIYYVVAVLLVLATVPMYRYIIVHARAGAADRPVSSVTVVPVTSPRVERLGVQPLAHGQQCHGGYVFWVSADTYVQAMDARGVALRCENGMVRTVPVAGG